VIASVYADKGNPAEKLARPVTKCRFRSENSIYINLLCIESGAREDSLREQSSSMIHLSLLNQLQKRYMMS
jgi:hypothetical protein